MSLEEKTGCKSAPEVINTNTQPQVPYGNHNIQYPEGQYPRDQGQCPGEGHHLPESGFPTRTVVVTQPGPTPMVSSQPPQQDWLVYAILSLFCFCPTGIFAILATNRAKNAAAIGNVVEAQRQWMRARTLVKTSVVIGIILTILSIASRVIAYLSSY